MKLMDMNREQLEARASKYSVKVSAKVTDKQLRRRIRLAMQEAKAEPAKEEVKSAKVKLGWPAELQENQRDYYEAVVGEPMPDDDAKSYRRFLKVIDEKVPSAVTESLPDGSLDCFGLMFDDKLKDCMARCYQMPLCRAVCAARPDLLKEVEASLAAKAEAEKLKAEDLEPAKKTKAKKEAEQPKAAMVSGRKGKGVRYNFQGVVKSYKAVLGDDDLYAIYKWISQQRSFSVDDLTARCGELFDPEAAKDYAAQTVDYLLSDGALVPV